MIYSSLFCFLRPGYFFGFSAFYAFSSKAASSASFFLAEALDCLLFSFGASAGASGTWNPEDWGYDLLPVSMLPLVTFGCTIVFYFVEPVGFGVWREGAGLGFEGIDSNLELKFWKASAKFMLLGGLKSGIEKSPSPNKA